MKKLKVRKLWKLLEIAIKDLKKFERTPNCIVSMAEWLVQYGVGGPCYGCLAGSVLKGTLGCVVDVGAYSELLPEKIDDPHTRDSMYALNLLRLGKTQGAVKTFYQNIGGSPPNADWVADDLEVVSYHNDKKKFYRDMNIILKILKAVNV